MTNPIDEDYTPYADTKAKYLSQNEKVLGRLQESQNQRHNYVMDSNKTIRSESDNYSRKKTKHQCIYYEQYLGNLLFHQLRQK